MVDDEKGKVLEPFLFCVHKYGTNNFPESKSNNGKIVTPQTQNGNADQHTEDLQDHSDQIGCINKKKDTDGNVTFTVKQLDARGKDVPDWSFRITDDAGALGIPRIINAPTGETADKVKKDDPENIRLWLTEGQRDIEWPATGQEIKTIFRNRGGVTNAAQQQADLMIARNRRFILQQSKTEMEHGQKYPKFNLNETEILPF